MKEIHGDIFDFLYDRTKRMLLNASGTVTSGIPQGSVLGRLMTADDVIQINDLPDAFDSYDYLLADPGVYFNGRAVTYATNFLAMRLTFQLVACRATNSFLVYSLDSKYTMSVNNNFVCFKLHL